jgi:hypothetical protein
MAHPKPKHRLKARVIQPDPAEPLPSIETTLETIRTTSKWLPKSKRRNG